MGGALAPFISGGEEGEAAQFAAKAIFSGVAGKTLIGQTAPNGVFVTDEMLTAAEEFCNSAKIPNAPFGAFYDVSFQDAKGKWRVETTVDHVALIGQTLHVDQFVYGWGIIEPENNWHLIACALGWLEQNPTFKPETIVLTIHQPRAAHHFGQSRDWSVDLKTLQKYRTSIGEVLTAPSDELRTGMTWCRKCPGLARCPAAQGAAMNAIDYAETAGDAEPENDTLARELDALERAKAAIENRLDALVKVTAHRVKNGQHVGNYAMAEAFGNRTLNNGLDAATRHMFTGKDLRKDALITPAQAVLAGVPESVVQGLCHRPKRGVKLVKADPAKLAEKLLKG